ncbi:MAG: hypothetical protein JO340_20815 [Acidobacteriaceae bacterium]|nr:hypothetical protein [Acidobacteriaceae bacterium]
MARSVAPALRALLEGVVDYAGFFPPAAWPLERALAGYHHYRDSRHAWMLGRFVIPAGQLPNVPANMRAPFAVLADEDDPRAATIESKQPISASKPIYCEVRPDCAAGLDSIKSAGCFAKIRTGGLTPDAVPSVDSLARFLAACAELQLPFKTTAGLHHPIRSLRPLTYQTNAPVAMVHGFINVFMAAAFAWNGERDIGPVLSETDAGAFHFDTCARWRNLSLSTDQIIQARVHFAHSFGSCSFEEPISDLERLGWL